MKKTDIIQPKAMGTIFAEDVYSSSGTTDFEIPAASSTSATDTCVIDEGFLPITSEPLPTTEEPDNPGIAPERKNFNGLFYLSTDQRIFLQNGGFITYSEDVANSIGGYPQGAILGYIDANNNFDFVISLVDDNQNTNFNVDASYIDNVNWAIVNSQIINKTRNISLNGDISAITNYNLAASNSITLNCTLNSSVFNDLDIDYSAPVSKATGSNFGFTADKRGLLYIRFTSRDSAGYIQVNGNNVANGSTTGNNGETDSSAQIPLSAGDVVTRSGTASAISTAIFYPTKGA